MRIENAGLGVTNPATEQTQTSGTQDEFLRLLVAQLENQDPLEPQESSEFVAQLAQFTAVEQGEETNRLLANLQQEQVASSNLAIAGMAGKQATFNPGNGFEVAEGASGFPDMTLELGGASPEVKIEVLDDTGRVAHTIELGPRAAGEHTISWDGTADGEPLDPGKYRFRLAGENSDGEAISGSFEFSGTIDSVDFGSGYPRLRVGSILVSPSDVLSIGQ